MVTLVDGVLANDVVMIFEIDIAFYAIKGMENLSLMIRLRILSIILSIFHTHLHNPNTCHTLVVSLVWETIYEIEHAFEDKQYQPEGILELFRKLHDDVQNIHEELAEYINTTNWNRPIVYYNDDDDEDNTIVITPNLSTEEPDNSLIMEDEHLDTILAMESDKERAANIDQSPPQEMSIQDMEDLKQHYLDEMKSLINDLQIKYYCNERIDIQYRRECEIKINELKENFNGMNRLRDDEESSIPLSDVIFELPPCVAITPVLSTEEPDNSLSMGDEHLDTIPATESDEVIKSNVEDLVQIPSESEGIPDNMCDVPFHDNSPPLDISKDQFEEFSNSNDDSTSIDDDSFSIDDIDYVDASPPESELVSLEVVENENGEIDTDILLTIKDDILREKLLNVNLLIAKIEALKDNPTPSFDFVTKSPSTSPNSLSMEETTHHLIITRVVSLAWETISEIEHAFEDKQYQPEGILEIFCKLHDDVQNIHEELADVEDLVHTPSESDEISKSECDLPVCDNSSPKKDEVLDDIISIPPGNGNDHFNVESSLIESVINRDNVISSPKIDFLLEEFARELALIAPIPLGIIEADFDPKGDICFIENLMYDNSFPRPPETLKDESETDIDSNNDYSSSDDDSPYSEDIDYVDALPPDPELVSLEVVGNVVQEDGEIDTDILLTIKDDILHEKLLKVNLLIAKIEALNADPTPSSDFVLKSPIPVEDGDSFLEKFETTPELETLKFDIEEKNSGSTTIHAVISLPDLECVYFKSEPDLGDLTSIDPGIHENVSSTTNVNLPFEDNQSPLFSYVVWIFLSFLMYPVAPPYLLSSGNEDTIFDPGISIYHSFMSGVSHRSGTFMKFNDVPDFEASHAQSFVH
ncbi:hypothetical protein Tco_0317575 [Tanacetum coccineum]